MLKQILLLTLSSFICVSCVNNKPKDDKQQSSGIIDDKNGDNPELYLIVGTYTVQDSKGIYVYRFDTITGKTSYVSEIDIENPSYLSVSNDEKYIYAVSENDIATAFVSSFSFDKENGKLSFVNRQSTGGAAPCYVSIDNTGSLLATANYSGGSVATFSVNDSGMIKPASQVFNFMGKGLDKERQSAPHLHCVVYSPDQKYLYATDLGTDKIYKFNVHTGDSSYLTMGEPSSFKLADGTGPRHLTFHPNGKFAYLITELSGEVIAFRYENGNLEQIQKEIADPLFAKGSADIHISPDGKFLYASNRLKEDGIAIFSVNSSTGKLAKIGYQSTGIHPRNFIITPEGNFLLVANRDSNNIQVFARNKNTGLLTDTKQNINLSMPVCLKFTSVK